MDVVERTWTEVGYRVRPLHRNVFVRTDPPEQKVGSLWLPPKLQSFHGDLPHMRIISATVLIAGPKTEVKPGERICFQRLHFAWLKKLEDGGMFGWIDQVQVLGYPAEDAHISSYPYSKEVASQSAA